MTGRPSHRVGDWELVVRRKAVFSAAFALSLFGSLQGYLPLCLLG
jgi:hypothetical protein